MVNDNISDIDKKFDALKSEFEKLNLKYDKYDRWIGTLRVTLTILAAINTFFLVGVGLFGYLGARGILDMNRESDKVKDIRRELETMGSQAKEQFSAQIDTFKNIKESFTLTQNEMILLQNKTKNDLTITLQQIDDVHKASENLKLEMSRELKNLKTRISGIDTNVTKLANIFLRTALDNQIFLNSRESALLFLLATKVYQTTGLAPERSGLLFYNLGVNFHQIGEYETAIEYFNLSLKLQPNLPEDNKQKIENLIEESNRGINDLEKIFAKEVKAATNLEDAVKLNNKIHHATREVLQRIGLLKPIHVDEIARRAALDN